MGIAIYERQGFVVQIFDSKFYIEVSAFQNMTGNFEVCNHSCKTGESVSHSSAIIGWERRWKDTTGVRFVHDGII